MSMDDRPLPAVQRAYFYVVLLVAIHMIVLGVANLLRVGAEIALGAPSGGFTGLPFVFADFNRPREQYREQASLAIALLLVAVPAWYLHYRAADAAARRSLAERGSALRSAYLQIVVLAGLGAALLPQMAIHEELRRGDLVALRVEGHPAPKRTIHLMTRAGAEVSPTANAFLRALPRPS